jgi:hypothetical protein
LAAGPSFFCEAIRLPSSNVAIGARQPHLALAELSKLKRMYADLAMENHAMRNRCT